MEIYTSRHRHFVALPILAAALVFSLVDIHGDFPNVLSSVTQIFSGAEDERFTLDSGVYGVVYAGGELEEADNHFVLTKGSVLLTSDGMIFTEVDGISLFSMNGAIHLTRGTKSIVIAALTTPVVVTSGDQRMVVPSGMQWEITDGIATLNDGFDLWMKARLPRPLPMSFVERKIGDLSLVLVPESTLPESKILLPLNIVPEGKLLLSVSESHVTTDRNEHILGVVRTTVEAEDADRFEELLNVPMVQDALATDRGSAVVAVLLSQTDVSHTVLRMLLLQKLVDSEPVWLASSFHPAYRDIAWAIFEPEVSVESSLSRVFLLPFSTFSPEPFSDFVLERFSVSLNGMQSKLGDSEAFVDNVLEAHMPLIDRLEDRGYPQRAQHLAQVISDLIASVEEPTDVMQQAADTLKQRSRIDLSPLPPKRDPEPEASSSSTASEVEPEVVLTPQQVEAKAYQMLEGAAALFTVNSAIAAYADNQARVTDILFSTETEDRAVSFTLDVATAIVTNIEINGNTDFPYSPSFDGFVNWVRK